MNMSESRFGIAADKIDEAFEALKKLAKEKEYMSWVDLDWILEEAKTFSEAMEEFRWQVEIDDDGDVNGISFLGEKFANDDDYIFEALAPFVKSGSYIEMNGEDGAIWRWAFRKGEFKEIYPEISWRWD